MTRFIPIASTLNFSFKLEKDHMQLYTKEWNNLAVRVSYLIFLDLQTSHYTVFQCLVDVIFDCICEFARSTYCMRSSKPLLAWFFGYVVCQIVHCSNWGVICNAGAVYNSASVSCSDRSGPWKEKKKANLSSHSNTYARIPQPQHPTSWTDCGEAGEEKADEPPMLPK